MKQNFAYPWKNLYQWYFTVKVTSIWHLRRGVNKSLSKAVRLETRFFSIVKWCLTFPTSRYNNKSSNKSSLQIMLIGDVIFLYLQTASKINFYSEMQNSYVTKLMTSLSLLFVREHLWRKLRLNTIFGRWNTKDPGSVQHKRSTYNQPENVQNVKKRVDYSTIWDMSVVSGFLHWHE